MGRLQWDARAVLRAVRALQELWCKKMPPTARLFQVYRPQAQPEPEQAPPPPGGPDREALRGLIRTADGLGALLQYRQQGFLPNKRQQRMAGLAAIEFAQAVRNLVKSLASTLQLSTHPYRAAQPAMLRETMSISLS